MPLNMARFNQRDSPPHSSQTSGLEQERRPDEGEKRPSYQQPPSNGAATDVNSITGSKNEDTVEQPATRTTSVDKPSLSCLHEARQLLAEQWFLVALGILIAIASQVQVPLSQQPIKNTIITYTCVSIIFFTTGCTLDTGTLLQNYSRWKLLLFVQTQCFLVTSALVFALVSATATSRFMDPALLVGLIFFGTVATTISSNVVMTRQAHGNTALTVVQTTVGNFIGVFVTPALVVMYTSTSAWYNDILPAASWNFPVIYRRVLQQLGLSIYVPLFVGQLLRFCFPKLCNKLFIEYKLNKIGSFCLLTVLWSTYDQAFASQAFESVLASNKIFIVFISIALWIVFFGAAFFTSLIWLPREDVVAIAYCVPAKGIVMAVPLTRTVFQGLDLATESKILIPIVIYQGLQLAFGSALIAVFRRWVEAGKEKERRANAERGTERNGTNESDV